MNKLIHLCAALAIAAPLAGCDTPEGQNAAGGAVLGGAMGALIGAAATGRPAGALAGAAIGAGTGALLGAAATPQPSYYGGPPPGYGGPPGRCAQWAYDYNGNRVCTAFY